LGTYWGGMALKTRKDLPRKTERNPGSNLDCLERALWVKGWGTLIWGLWRIFGIFFHELGKTSIIGWVNLFQVG